MYIHNGRKFIQESNHDPSKDIDELCSRMKGTPDYDGSIHLTIERNWYYFRKLRSKFEEALRENHEV